MAQRGINKVILICNLGQDPEVKYFDNGGCICNMTVATSETWKDKNTGENKERTEWHRVAIDGKLGEIAGKYLNQGSKVYLEGKLRTRKWQDQEGNDRYTTEVYVSSFDGTMQMLGSNGAPKQTGQSQPAQQQQPVQQQSQPAPVDFDESIPF